MNSPQNFLKPGKKFCVLPGQVRQAVASDAPLRRVLKQVMVNTGGNKGRSPQKRQNRGSRNSADDGG
ncbi:single-stranded DNA-binding protein [Klebsiella pneumoniae]|uniref:single-stranded DNA-binding protein n=1 Tax=Klebsiella pneumoniae TaxID=573 RepID=UPI0038910707